MDPIQLLKTSLPLVIAEIESLRMSKNTIQELNNRILELESEIKSLRDSSSLQTISSTEVHDKYTKIRPIVKQLNITRNSLPKTTEGFIELAKTLGEHGITIHVKPTSNPYCVRINFIGRLGL